jgi:hypothetical protein
MPESNHNINQADFMIVRGPHKRATEMKAAEAEEGPRQGPEEHTLRFAENFVPSVLAGLVTPRDYFSLSANPDAAEPIQRMIALERRVEVTRGTLQGESESPAYVKATLARLYVELGIAKDVEAADCRIEAYCLQAAEQRPGKRIASVQERRQSLDGSPARR